jgi:hypothetical protein
MCEELRSQQLRAREDSDPLGLASTAVATRGRAFASAAGSLGSHASLHTFPRKVSFRVVRHLMRWFAGGVKGCRLLMAADLRCARRNMKHFRGHRQPVLRPHALVVPSPHVGVVAHKHIDHLLVDALPLKVVRANAPHGAEQFRLCACPGHHHGAFGPTDLPAAWPRLEACHGDCAEADVG